MNLYSCDCGVVLDLDSNILIHIDNDRQVHFYVCPVCNKRIEVD